MSQDPVKRIAAQIVMRFLPSVQADPERVGGSVQRQRAVGGYRHTQEMPAGAVHQIVQAVLAVAPQQRLPAFKNDDARSETAQGFQGADGCVPGHMADIGVGPEVKGAGPAGQIAPMGDFEACQQGNAAAQDFPLPEKTRQIDRPGNTGGFHDSRICRDLRDLLDPQRVFRQDLAAVTGDDDVVFIAESDMLVR